MLEVILLIFLARDLGKIAKQKGLRASAWQIYLVAGWILAEMIGVFVGFMIVGTKDLISLLLIAIAFAFSSYFILRAQLYKYPDATDDDIDNIGNR